MPTGIVGGRPAPAPRGASLLSVSRLVLVHGVQETAPDRILDLCQSTRDRAPGRPRHESDIAGADECADRQGFGGHDDLLGGDFDLLHRHVLDGAVHGKAGQAGRGQGDDENDDRAEFPIHTQPRRGAPATRQAEPERREQTRSNRQRVRKPGAPARPERHAIERPDASEPPEAQERQTFASAARRTPQQGDDDSHDAAGDGGVERRHAAPAGPSHAPSAAINFTSPAPRPPRRKNGKKRPRPIPAPARLQTKPSKAKNDDLEAEGRTRRPRTSASSESARLGHRRRPRGNSRRRQGEHPYQPSYQTSPNSRSSYGSQWRSGP